MSQHIEGFAQRLIKLHGFGSNEQRGFSCFVPDTHRFPRDEGMFLWNYSRSYRRIETQIQKYHTETRIYRMNEMLGMNEFDYKWAMVDAVEQYLNQLKAIGCFGSIGSGIDLFAVRTLSNIAANFEFLERHPNFLKKLEEVTIDNPIVRFAEEKGYFQIMNRDMLAWDELFE